MLEPLGSEPSFVVFSAAMAPRSVSGASTSGTSVSSSPRVASRTARCHVVARAWSRFVVGESSVIRGPSEYDVLDEPGLLAGVEGAAAEGEVPGQPAGGPAALLSDAQQRAHHRLTLRHAALRAGPGGGSVR